MSREYKIDHHIVKLDDVMRYFADGFTFKEGFKLHRFEAFVDTAKGKVVFELHTVKEAE